MRVEIRRIGEEANRHRLDTVIERERARLAATAAAAGARSVGRPPRGEPHWLSKRCCSGSSLARRGRVSFGSLSRRLHPRSSPPRALTADATPPAWNGYLLTIGVSVWSGVREMGHS